VNAAQLTHDELVEQALIERARVDPLVFNDYVLKNEETGAPTLSCGMHAEMHKLADEFSRLQLVTFIESGKTVQFAIGRALWELGRNPELRIVIASAASPQTKKIISAISRYITTSPELHKVFPNLKPDPAGPWNQSAITVARSSSSKDPSVQGVGVHSAILGARVDLLILDDVCDYENSRTQALRDDLDRWVRSTLLGRLTGNARAWVLGNCWHRDDVYSRFEKSGWETRRYAVTNVFGRSRWPEQWPAARIAAKRIDLQRREAARQLDVVPPDDADPIIDPELIARALSLGENASTEYHASATEPGAVIVLGVDTAYSSKESADQSALVMCRTNPRTGAREIVQVWAGRWNLDQLVETIVNICRMHRATAAIESNAGGEYVAQMVEKTKVGVIRCTTTGASKKLRVEMLVSEFAASRWSFRQPGTLPEPMRLLAQELRNFSYEEHCGDRAAAFFVAIEAIRQLESKPRPKGKVFPWNK